MKDIRALKKEELQAFFLSHGEKAFRANQVYEWLWTKGAHSFEQMTNLSKETRQLLSEHFVINHIKVDTMQRSEDGTIKNAVRLHDGLYVESVLIPTDTRITACVSSQVGCSLNCSFCATARLKRMRNLSPDEIFDQVLTIDQQSRLYYGRPLRNIVFMGMGEPLMNYPNVMKAIERITSEKEGLGFSPKRITVSTSGVSSSSARWLMTRSSFALPYPCTRLSRRHATRSCPGRWTSPYRAENRPPILVSADQKPHYLRICSLERDQ